MTEFLYMSTPNCQDYATESPQIIKFEIYEEKS